MPSWIDRVSALLGVRTPAAPAVAPDSRARRLAPRAQAALARPVPAAETPAASGAATGDLQQSFFEWLLDANTTLDVPLLPHEHRLLARLDAVLAAGDSRTDLLPRAPAVIPQLMNSLRDESRSAHALAERVAKDPNLVAEVIRLANSAGTRAAEPVNDLAQAISRLGTQGLRRAIAKVVLKPIFDAPPDSLSGRAAPRLWLHSEAKAAECMRLAAAAGLDPFEGYLAGLMHNIGWTAALQALDKAEDVAKLPFTAAFVQAFEVRREKFFATILQSWQLTDSLTALAAELLGDGVESAPSTLARTLRAADRCASLAMLGAGAPGAFDEARPRAADLIVSHSSESSAKGA